MPPSRFKEKVKTPQVPPEKDRTRDRPPAKTGSRPEKEKLEWFLPCLKRKSWGGLTSPYCQLSIKREKGPGRKKKRQGLNGCSGPILKLVPPLRCTNARLSVEKKGGRDDHREREGEKPLPRRETSGHRGTRRPSALWQRASRQEAKPSREASWPHVGKRGARKERGAAASKDFCFPTKGRSTSSATKSGAVHSKNGDDACRQDQKPPQLLPNERKVPK